jgi:hypothetical protein
MVAVGSSYSLSFVNPYRCRFHSRKTLSNNFFRIGNAFTETKRLISIGSIADSSSESKTLYGGSSESSLAKITQHILKSHTKLRLCVMTMFGSQFEYNWTGETFTPAGQWELWEREPEMLDLVAQFAVSQRYLGPEKRTRLLQSVAMGETVVCLISLEKVEFWLKGFVTERFHLQPPLFTLICTENSQTLSSECFE